jgi:hypothetical protein
MKTQIDRFIDPDKPLALPGDSRSLTIPGVCFSPSPAPSRQGRGDVSAAESHRRDCRSATCSSPLTGEVRWG